MDIYERTLKELASTVNVNTLLDVCYSINYIFHFPLKLKQDWKNDILHFKCLYIYSVN